MAPPVFAQLDHRSRGYDWVLGENAGKAGAVVGFTRWYQSSAICRDLLASLISLANNDKQR